MTKTKKVFLSAILTAAAAMSVIPASAAEHAQASAVQQQEPKAVTYAKSLIGTPYKAAGTTPKGFDASGFVQHVYQKAGLKLPRTSKDMFAAGQKTTVLQPGDLVFYDTKNTTKKEVSFVGIYIGKEQFIAVTVSKGVSIQKMNDTYWKTKYMGARKAPVSVKK